jgi:phospholipid transport system transporter-binding protein
MTLHAEIIEQNGCLAVAGNLNFQTVTKLWHMSQPLLTVVPVLTFDLAKVTAVNSAGLALLLQWQRYALTHKKAIAFVNMPPQLVSIAKVAGIAELLKQHYKM